MRFLRLLLLVIVSFILSFGLVVMANGFRVLSFARFAGTAALLTPIISLLLYLLNRVYPFPEFYCPLRERRKEALTVLSAALVLSVLLVPQYASAWRYLLTILLVALTFFLWSVIALLPFINGHDGYLEKIFLYFSLLAGGIGLVLFLYVSLHARMYGDDFCYHIRVLENGYLPTVIDFYLTWSGRFSSNFVLFAASGFRHASLIQIILIVTSVFISVYMLSSHGGARDKRLVWSAASAALVTFLALFLTPDTYKPVLWLVSSAALLPVMVLLPPYLLLVWAAFKMDHPRLVLYSILGFTLSFLITTTHEVATLPMLALNSSLLLIALLSPKGKRESKLVTGAALAGAVTGALVTFLSPGNFSRHTVQAYPTPPDLLTLLSTNWSFFISYLQGVLGDQGWLALLGVFVLGYIGWIQIKRRWLSLGIVFALTAVMIWLSFIPGTYVAQVPIPPRSQFIPTVWLVAGVFCAGLLSPRIKSRYIYLSLLSIVLLAGVFNYWNTLRSAYDMVQPVVTYARDWDARQRLMLTSRLQPERIDTFIKVYVTSIYWTSQ